MPQNFVLETSNAPGAATEIPLAGAPLGYRTWLAQVGAGLRETYIARGDNGLWEGGVGYAKAGTPATFVRETVLDGSSGPGVRVNFTAQVDVYNAPLAEFAVGVVSSAVTPTNGAIDIAIPPTGRVFEIDASLLGLVGSQAGRQLYGHVSLDGTNFLTGPDDYASQADISYGTSHADNMIFTPYLPLSGVYDVPLTSSVLSLRLTLGPVSPPHILWTMGHVFNANTRALKRGWGVVNSFARPRAIRLVDSAGLGILAQSFVTLRRLG